MKILTAEIKYNYNKNSANKPIHLNVSECGYSVFSVYKAYQCPCKKKHEKGITCVVKA